ncbi:hypothetical protein CABS01_05393 [Colletotrichum abscissum]|uniref:uncharacterized protein n=1 Tax=Colletotrichum abscissum TaxID=1671311 RepID=UPI0027D73FE9|nr:uncharacterized protein CABS01_05393 [Colletotrichum abscissum]KAK1520888.1 hypothetical protein CABS01_05393 [Colletotrichum abscissum]
MTLVATTCQLGLSSASTLGLFIVARKSMAEMFTRFGLRGGAKGTMATCVSFPDEFCLQYSTKLFIEHFFFAFGSRTRVCLGRSRSRKHRVQRFC